MPISTLITREPILFKLIQRSTRLATVDLLLPGSTASFRSATSNAGYSTVLSATILELQLASLDNSLQKVEALNIVPDILDDLLSLYPAATYPMRRAR